MRKRGAWHYDGCTNTLSLIASKSRCGTPRRGYATEHGQLGVKPKSIASISAVGCLSYQLIFLSCYREAVIADERWQKHGCPTNSPTNEEANLNDFSRVVLCNSHCSKIAFKTVNYWSPWSRLEADSGCNEGGWEV